MVSQFLPPPLGSVCHQVAAVILVLTPLKWCESFSTSSFHNRDAAPSVSCQRQLLITRKSQLCAIRAALQAVMIERSTFLQDISGLWSKVTPLNCHDLLLLLILTAEEEKRCLFFSFCSPDFYIHRLNSWKHHRVCSAHWSVDRWLN